jgi:hypothetical protein
MNETRRKERYYSVEYLARDGIYEQYGGVVVVVE